MGVPVLTSCCGCTTLTNGAYILGAIAIAESIVCIAIAASALPDHTNRSPEDNLLSMMAIMDASFFLVSNVILLTAVKKELPGFVHKSMLFNVLLLVFGMLLLISACLFSPQLSQFCLSTSLVLGVSTLAIVIFLVIIYYFLVVNSLHLQLKRLAAPTPVPV